MKTQEQILAKLEEHDPRDIFDWIRSDLIHSLTFENAKPFLKPEFVEQSEASRIWEDESHLTDESVLAELIKYIPFAWEKANNCRGISAARSLSHFTAWTWLLGDEDKLPDLDKHEYYGKPHLVEICKLYGVDPDLYDDGHRTNRDTT